MAVKTVIPFDEMHEPARRRPEALGQSMTDWQDDAARTAARRQNAAAYLAWEAEAHPNRFDEADEASATISLAGAEW